MIPTLLSLLDMDFMLPICRHVINSGSVTIVLPLVILSVF